MLVSYGRYSSFYFLAFLFFFMGKTALLRRAGKERPNIANMVVQDRILIFCSFISEPEVKY